MFDVDLQWDRPARCGSQPTVHILRVRLMPTHTTESAQIGLPLRLALALDTSGSMAGAKMAGAAAACRAILALLRPQDSLSLAAYGDELRILLNSMSGGVEAFEAGEAAVIALKPLGVTRTDLALDWLLKALPAEAGTLPIALLITDGIPTDAQGRPLTSAVPLLAQATNLGDNRITLYTVGLGDAADFNTGLLVDLSDRGRGAFLYSAEPESLATQLRARLDLAQSIAEPEASLHFTSLVPGVQIKAACRLRPEFLPLTVLGAGQTSELTLPALCGDNSTDILLSVTVPPPDFGEPLGVHDILQIRLRAGNSEAVGVAALVYTASYREAQQLNVEADQDRLHWETNTYSSALARTSDSRRTSVLLADLATSARRSGRIELADRAEREMHELQPDGLLKPHNAADLLTSTRELGAN